MVRNEFKNGVCEVCGKEEATSLSWFKVSQTEGYWQFIGECTADMEDKFTVNLGWCVAQLAKRNGDFYSLTIMSPSSCSEFLYSPAESVVVHGEDNMNNLLSFLKKHLK